MLCLSTPSVARLTLSVCFFLLCFTPVVSAQSSSHRSTTVQPDFEKQFWKYLIGNNYKNWAPVAGKSADFYPGKRPHGALLKTYVNRTAAGTIGDLATGSVVILENYTPDRSLSTISVMYRTTDFNPQANDWYWVQYRPDGTVIKPRSASSRSSIPVVNVSLNGGATAAIKGKSNQCIQCHQSAGGGDFVFTNDSLNLSPSDRYAALENNPMEAPPKNTNPTDDDPTDIDGETEDFFRIN